MAYYDQLIVTSEKFDRALSIRAHWAYLIANGIKDIENRTWSTKVRGRFLIHASQTWTNQDKAECEALRARHGLYIPAELPRGGIVGEAHITDVVSRSNSEWFTGPFGFVLRYAKPLDFHTCTGSLGWFRIKTKE